MVELRQVLLTPLLAVFAACRPAAAGAPLAPRPGASLFDSLERLEVVHFADSNVPEPLRTRVTEALAVRSQTIAPEQWVQAGQAPRRAGELLWRVQTQIRMDLGLGRPWLTHDGRACVPFNLVPRRENQPTAITGWKDPAGGLTFGWSARAGELVASACERPREVSLGWEFDAEHDGLALEPVLQRGVRPQDARGLQRTLVFGQSARPVLAVATPSRLAVEVDLQAVDELRLAVALWDVGFAPRGEQLARVPSPGDGMGFSVLAGGETVWSREVTERNVFHDASIDLTRFRGRRLELAFETDPGPGGDARFDYGVWSGLSLHGEARVAPARPHVVLIDVDTLRADRLGCYGYTRDTSPRLDRWAASEAVLYEDALSTACWTLPATISMLTGLAPVQHRVYSGQMTMSPELTPIARRLRAAGYETHGRSDGAFVSSSFGFGEGFERYDCEPRPREEHERIGWQPELARIRERRSERPLFYFLQTYQVHGPYPQDRRFEDPARPYRGRLGQENPSHIELVRSVSTLEAADWRWLNDTYDAGIRRMDDVVGAFLEGLGAAFGDDPYLVIVTSDHGEEIGDHGDFGHGHDLHEELLRVPLLVRFPGGPAGARESRPVSSLDLVPTILDWAGLEVPAHLPGRSLRQPLPERRLRVAEHEGTAFAAHLDGWKLLSGLIAGYRGPNRFPLLLRRGDERGGGDLLALEDERARELRALLQAYLARYPDLGVAHSLAAPDEALVVELRQLGYAGDE